MKPFLRIAPHLWSDRPDLSGVWTASSERYRPASRREPTSVFLVVNDPSADDFARYADDGEVVNGYHQARSLPSGKGAPVHFLGSTTGPDCSEEVSSRFQVSWSVRPTCAKLDIGSLSRWCQGNVFKEDHGHGVRGLVVKPRLLGGIGE